MPAPTGHRLGWFGVEIREDDPQGEAIASLLREHLESMAEHSPPESVHALDSEALSSPDITFWTGWQGDELLGCGALKELDAGHGEIKSMRTATAHLRKALDADQAGMPLLEVLLDVFYEPQNYDHQLQAVEGSW